MKNNKKREQYRGIIHTWEIRFLRKILDMTYSENYIIDFEQYSKDKWEVTILVRINDDQDLWDFIADKFNFKYKRV